eukprot:2612023-Rhodomonas_salina.3
MAEAGMAVDNPEVQALITNITFLLEHKTPERKATKWEARRYPYLVQIFVDKIVAEANAWQSLHERCQAKMEQASQPDPSLMQEVDQGYQESKTTQFYCSAGKNKRCNNLAETW